MHELVAASGAANFAGIQIPVPTRLNITSWIQLLKDYSFPNIVLLDYLQFGWPINFRGDIPSGSPHNYNHKSALQHSDTVDKFICTEVKAGATLGPFSQVPFSSKLCLSPLQTVPGSSKRRVVVDLSFPQGASVNDGISKDDFLQQPMEMHYPSVESLAQMVREKGRGCLLYKRDLSRAYRQLYTCPSQWNLTAYTWRGSIYVDVVEVFGLRSAAYACQSTTAAVSFLMSKQGYSIVNYLDDFGGADTPSRAHGAYEALGSLLALLGLQENADKAEPPHTTMVFLGILLDTISLTLTIPQDKLEATRALLGQWLKTEKATVKELQSLLGSLHHIACCVRPGKIFLNRMLATLRTVLASGSRTFTPDQNFTKDVLWWHTCMASFNGISIMPETHWEPPDAVFSTDACLTGAGGFCQGRFFHTTFPQELRNTSIQGLEMMALLIAVKLWAPQWQGKRLLIFCDNEAVVSVIQSGRSRDGILQAGLRELNYLCTINSVDIVPRHLSSSDNRLADHLSRWNLSPSHAQAFYALASKTGHKLIEEHVSNDLFRFTHPW